MGAHELMQPTVGRFNSEVNRPVAFLHIFVFRVRQLLSAMHNLIVST